MISKDGKCDKEIKTTPGKANTTFGTLTDTTLNLEVKKRLYQESLILATL